MESLQNKLKARNLAFIGKSEETVIEKGAYIEPTSSIAADPIVKYMTRTQLEKAIEQIRKQMQEAAKKLDFIEAAQYRDELLKLQEMLPEKQN